MEAITVLLGIGLIILFGVFAEFVFKKIKLPDALFLMFLGFIIGPHVLDYVSVDQFAAAAPAFTTFTLLFLLFDGAFNIDLVSFAKGIYYSLSVTLFNFLISSVVVSLVMFSFGYSVLVSILTGFILGGISSSFVIPVLKSMAVKKEVYSLLTLESAFTDVLCIVFALTVLDIFTFESFNFQSALSSVVSLFAVAAVIGIVAGAIWVALEVNLFKEHKSYMMTVAVVLLVYVLTDYLKGNGAIAALFFGLMLRNSKQLISISKGILSKKKSEQKKAITGELGVSVLSPSEKFFYDQIGFFLKTFFFVYIGILLDLSNPKLLLIGGVISLAVFLARNLTSIVTLQFTKLDRSIINSFSARGLAAAALAAIIVQEGVPRAHELAIIVYSVILGSIILSSLRIFVVSLRHHPEPVAEPSDNKKPVSVKKK